MNLWRSNQCPLKKREIGEHDCHSGNWKGVGFDVFVVKYTNYNMIMMFTYSGLTVGGDQKEEY